MGRPKGILKQTKIDFVKTVTVKKEQTSKNVLPKKHPVEKFKPVALKKTDVSADAKTKIVVKKQQVTDQDRSFVYVCTKCEGKFDSKKVIISYNTSLCSNLK